MKVAAALLLLLPPAAGAATAYVTDELVLGVYADQTTQGSRLATLHSGASVETLVTNGESTQVRLPDGRIGWVKTSYLTTREPATAQVRELQDELERTRAAASVANGAAPTAPPAVISAPPAPDRARDPGAGSRLWLSIAAVVAAGGGGFWLGYAALARRIRERFGGIKVY